MATLYEIHPQNPQKRTIEQINDALKRGAVMLYPTDTVYAIGCDLTVKSAVQKVRQIKQISNDKPLTFLCSSLSNIADYAIVTDEAYRTIKRLIPGSYTFVLPATKQVPKLVMSPKRKTTGIRVPDHPVCLAILESLGNPVISTSAHIKEEDEPSALIRKIPQKYDKFQLFDALENLVDIIVDDGADLDYQVSTIIDLSADDPVLVRRGKGWEAIADWDLPEE
ncbi:MAG: threonylcarbamoyl-AMP synthase [Arthrospira sp. SH-MAG29]|nr:L-threonylcarbamoyladenylate synthase [Arthrospira sp. SH-MAG29]MBS0018647.1 threonylcarbamoyl-AMP synthase [Arthrospira sp. SH-MAG29]